MARNLLIHESPKTGLGTFVGTPEKLRNSGGLGQPFCRLGFHCTWDAEVLHHGPPQPRIRCKSRHVGSRVRQVLGADING